MRDFARFVLRGALAGMIVPIVLMALLLILLLGGPSGALALIYFPQYFLYAAIPGGLVGILLWFLNSRIYSSLGSLRRIAIGAATVIAIAVAPSVYYFANYSYYTITLQSVLWTLTIGGLQGALAGLACPARRLYLKEGQLTYIERVRLYEAADSEAKSAGEKKIREQS